jgi:hypothetical protein
MKTNCLILYLLLLLAIPSVAQEQYQVSGSVIACYNKDYKEAISDIFVRITLRSLDHKQEYSTTMDGERNFSFDMLPAGNYILAASALGLTDNDTTIVVDQNISNVTFCVDRAYRPAPVDSVERYRQRAIADIKNGTAKIYEWTPWSITKDPFEKLNPNVKKKYGFEYEMMSCVREQTREEIVQVKLWQVYNEVVYQHLAKLHGQQWRNSIKHERQKLLKE